MLNEWPSPQISSNSSRYSEVLDYGCTIPLRHPPVLSSANLQFNSSSLTSAPHCTLEPLEVSPSGQMTQAVRGNCLAHPLPSKTTTYSPLLTLRSNSHSHSADKKRWQTADYRWMFTKRKGKFFKLVLDILFFRLGLLSY